MILNRSEKFIQENFLQSSKWLKSFPLLLKSEPTDDYVPIKNGRVIYVDVKYNLVNKASKIGIMAENFPKPFNEKYSNVISHS